MKKLRRQRDSTYIEDFWEPSMKEVDQLLEDAALVESLYNAQGKRHPNNRTRGTIQTPKHRWKWYFGCLS